MKRRLSLRLSRPGFAEWRQNIHRLWRYVTCRAVVPLLLLLLLTGCEAAVNAAGPKATSTSLPIHTATSTAQAAQGGIGSGVAAPGSAGQPATPVGTPTATPVATPAATATATPTSTPPAVSTATAVAANVGTVDVASLNVRAGPGTGYAVLTTVPQGTQFTVQGQDATGSWLQVALSDGSAGWVDRSLTVYAGTAPIVAAPQLAATATPTPTPASVNPPAVQLLAPGTNASYLSGGEVTVQWSATDSSGIALAQVQLLVRQRRGADHGRQRGYLAPGQPAMAGHHGGQPRDLGGRHRRAWQRQHGGERDHLRELELDHELAGVVYHAAYRQRRGGERAERHRRCDGQRP